jgi:hypothetical protein
MQKRLLLRQIKKLPLIYCMIKTIVFIKKLKLNKLEKKLQTIDIIDESVLIKFN